METKYIKQYIDDMEGDKRADNLTEFGECLLKELKQLLSVCEQKQTEQQSNCNLPHVSNLVCPTHGTMLYKHPNGLAYCSLCNYSISWQTCC